MVIFNAMIKNHNNTLPIYHILRFKNNHLKHNISQINAMARLVLLKACISTETISFHTGEAGMRQIWKDRFKREILLILIIKIVLIFAIWWSFFRVSETPSPEQVSRTFLDAGHTTDNKRSNDR